LRKRLGIPKDLGFKTKVELAWEMIEAAIIQAIPFEIVGFDSLYGRSGWLRAQVRAALVLLLISNARNSR
jgi:SRSO17 transposase